MNRYSFPVQDTWFTQTSRRTGSGDRGSWEQAEGRGRPLPLRLSQVQGPDPAHARLRPQDTHHAVLRSATQFFQTNDG